MENYFVYIIKSESTGVFYKGFTTCIERRLFEHNNGLTRYSNSRGPWILVFLEKFDTKQEALIIERKLKKCNPKYLETLIQLTRHTI